MPSKSEQKRIHPPFVGAWVDLPTKRKLQAMAVLAGKSQQAIVADLIRNAPLVDVTTAEAPDQQPA